jgi:hypothetical protein
LRESGFRTHRIPGGFAYEIHEGGPLRALLPDALRRIEAGESVVLDSGTRQLRLQRTDAGYQALLLAESDRQEPTPLKPGPRLTPWVKEYKAFFNFAAGMLSLGLLTLVCSIILSGLLNNFEVRRLGTLAQEKLSNIPSINFPTPPAPGEYVTRHEYVNGRWSTDHRRPAPKVDLAIDPQTLAPLLERGVLGVPLLKESP